ncbi:DUF4435 domain-containing protein [Neobacillus sp. LXY-4]|uniref:DUF4435 domain-containing protein n=1 Tax=Neobacillus sp. LXY-4 TaxID=3379826 RepID=UPI003EE108D6
MNNTNMNRDEMLRKKRQKGIVGFHKFSLKFKPKKSIPYCFVEGEDSKYYLPRVSMICKSEPDFVKCNGKKGVLDTYNEIKKHKEFNDEKLFFFVDSDFDVPVNNVEIYETPCYSIENLYTSLDAFKRILKNEFNLEETDEDYNKAIDTFIERQNEFHDLISLLNSWIYSYKDYMYKTGEEIKLRLNELILKEHLVDITLHKITCKYTLQQIEEFLNITKKIPNSNVTNIHQTLNSHPKRGSIFRGKFELEFFKIFLDKVVEDRNKKTGRQLFQEKGKIRLSLDSNILITLSTYADTPDCLFTYIHKRWTRKLLTTA